MSLNDHSSFEIPGKKILPRVGLGVPLPLIVCATGQQPGVKSVCTISSCKALPTHSSSVLLTR